MDVIDKIKKLYNLSSEENHGYTEDIITELEKRLNINLPKILRNYYLHLGRNTHINEEDMVLFRIDGTRDINRLYGYPYINDEYFVFYGDYETAFVYGIKTSDLKKDNPKVSAICRLSFYAEPRFYEWQELFDLDKFLLFMAYFNGTIGSLKYRRIFSNKEEVLINNDTIKIIEDNWSEITELSTKGIPFYSDVEIRHFTNDNFEIIILVNFKDNKKRLYVGTSYAEKLEKILSTLKIK